MKKALVVFLLILISISLFSASFTELQKSFIEIRSCRKIQDMKILMDNLSKSQIKESNLMALYSDALTEYAIWGTEVNTEKDKIFEKAIEIGKKAVELDKNNFYAFYVTGQAIGKLSMLRGVMSSIIMLGDFDKYIDTALKLKPDYAPSLEAKAMRLANTPFIAGGDVKKAEELFLKAIKISPENPSYYYELAKLYRKNNNKNEAIKYFNKILEIQPDADWIELTKEMKNAGRKNLAEMGVK